MKKYKTVSRSFKEEWPSSLCWHKNGRDLAFTLSSEGIYLYNLETDEVEKLQGWTLGGFITDQANDMFVVYERERKIDSRYQTYLLDPANKQRRPLEDVNGLTIEIPGTTKIVMMVGY